MLRFFFAFTAGATAFVAPLAHAQLPPAQPLATPPAGRPKADQADPAATGYARQIVELMLPPERRQEITQGLMQTVMNQIRSSLIGRSNDPGLHQILDAYLAKLPEQLRPVGERHMPWIMDAIAQAYTRQFSIDELKQISEFGKTAAGAHFLSRNLNILSDPAVVHANQVYFNDAAQAANVGAPQLRAAVVDYLNKHPDVARQLQAQAQQQHPAGQPNQPPRR